MVVEGIKLALIFVLLTGIAFAAGDSHEQFFKKSIITLNDLAEVPGMVIEPGTYVLKAEEAANTVRAVVQLLNQDETQVLATFIAVPDYRQRPEIGVITFFEGVTSGPRPVQTWHCLGEMNGYEFVYPKPRAKEIAKHTEGAHVIASDSQEADIIAITSNGTEVPLYDATMKSASKSGDVDVKREKPSATTAAAQRTRRPAPRF